MPDLHPLIVFLDARLREDEAGALLAQGGAPTSWSVPDRLLLCGTTGCVVDDDSSPLFWTDDPFCEAETGRAVADHIARHDPARVLAECQAKREIVNAHRPALDFRGHPLLYSRDAIGEPRLGCQSCGAAGEWYHEDWPCWTISQLASIWADHPDYQDQWKPDEAERP